MDHAYCAIGARLKLSKGHHPITVSADLTLS